MEHEKVVSLSRPGGASVAARWGQLLVGLFGFGVAVALMVRSDLGLGPWDAFHFGLHRLIGISVGTASISVGVLIVGLTWLMGERPGAGTVVNMVLIGVFIDLLLPLVPAAPNAVYGLGYYGLAIGLAGVSTGMYIAPGLGKGPRDGLAMILSERGGVPVRRVRTILELTVLGAGWGLGGAVGIGTLLFSLLIGPSMQWGLQLFGVQPVRPPEKGRPERLRRAA